MNIYSYVRETRIGLHFVNTIKQLKHTRLVVIILTVCDEN